MKFTQKKEVKVHASQCYQLFNLEICQMGTLFFLKDLKFFYPHQQNNTRDLLYLEISWDTSEFRAT